jgi:hypothetical protein
MSLLDKSYIATKYTGEVFSIDNIEELISSWGAKKFSQFFGLEHKKRPSGVLCSHFEDDNFWRYGNTTSDGFIYQFEYILEDFSGKAIDPKNILLEYLEKKPNNTKIKYPSGIGKKWRRHWRARFKRSNSIYRLLRQSNAIVKEDNEPIIRKNSSVMFCGYYDDDYPRRTQKSWKQYRKTQYK